MSIRTGILTFLTLLLALLAGRCHDSSRDPRLARIAASVSNRPEEALASLDSIDKNTLSKSDRHYLDLLTIKARDKAYIDHESDSLVLDVIDYYSSRPEAPEYPEALYYGGRVYSDLGDSQTALKFYHKALDILPEDTPNQKLRCSALSQTARLLDKLRLYNEAIPNIKGAIAIDRKLNDSVNEVYDIQLMGDIYLRADKYIEAERCFSEALNRSKNMPYEHTAKSLMYLATIKYRLEDIDSALFYIRNTPETVDPIVRNSALARAADIYYSGGIMDTAFLYANQLVSSGDNSNKASGYMVLFTPELRRHMTPDTVDRYLEDYLTLLESYYNNNENQLAISQRSLYNYSLHERERLKAENSNVSLRQWIVGISMLALCLALLVLFLRKRNAMTRLELRLALANIDRLRQSLAGRVKALPAPENNLTDLAVGYEPAQESVSELREILRDRLYDIYSRDSKSQAVDPRITESSTYGRLQEFIAKGKELKSDDPLWKDLEELVLGVSPDFKKNLQLLVGGQLMSYDLNTSLLIKCGVPFTQMTVLLNRSKGAVVSRRESLCFRVFDRKMGTKVIDGIIRLL